MPPLLSPVYLLLMLLLAAGSLHKGKCDGKPFGMKQQDSGKRQLQPLGRRISRARVRAHYAPARRSDCQIFRAETKPDLSEFGKKVKTIVLAGLGGGRVCEANTGDWRANLPRFLGAYTGAEVIVYDPRQRSCQTCYSTQKGRRKIPCEDHMNSGVDMLLLIGSGKIKGKKNNCAPGVSWCPRQFQDLASVMEQRWARRANRTIHFPIRNMFRLVNNKVFHFDVIIEDASFAKPPGRCTVEAFNRCRDSPKQKTLVYIARIMTAKGQLNFIRQADPKVLKGYTVKFFGRHQNPDYAAEAKALATQKGIKVSFPGEVSKEQLTRQMCEAQGIITFSMDKNPRSIYEGVQAGLPVFVSAEAQTATSLTAQPFVFEVSKSGRQDTIDERLTQYMELVRAGNWSAAIREWAHNELTMDAVYTALCQRMGVCADGAHKYDPWFGHDFKESRVVRERRYTAENMLYPSNYASGRALVLTATAKQRLARQQLAEEGT